MSRTSLLSGALGFALALGLAPASAGAQATPRPRPAPASPAPSPTASPAPGPTASPAPGPTASPAPAAFEGGTVHEAAEVVGRRVVGITFSGAVAEAERLAELSTVRVGNPYEPVEVRETLDLFYQKGLFEAIAVEARPEGEGVRVIFHFTPQRLITSWRFVGNHHVESEPLERAMSLTWGQPLLPSRLEGYRAAIARVYERVGYPNATATFSVQLEGAREAELTVTVVEGEPIALAGLEVVAPGPLGEGELKRLLALKTGRALTREDLFTAIERVQSALTRERYLNARVNHFFRRPDGRRISTYGGLLALPPGPVTLVVAIEAGQRGLVAVDADVLLPTSELAEAITVYENRSYSPFELDHSARRLRERYAAAGYPQAEVRHTIERQPDDSYLITFHVEAGQRMTVRAISFVGNEAFDDETLKRVLVTRPAGPLGGGVLDPDVWERDLRSLQAYYASHGYLKMSVAGVERLEGNEAGELALVVRVNEGPRQMINRLVFDGVSGLHEAGLLQTLRVNPGDPYDPSELPEYVASVEAYYARSGYPLARATADYEAGSGVLRLKVVTGPRKRIGHIVLRGNFKTEDFVVRRQLTVARGDRYNSEELLATQQRIYQLGFFDRVNVSPLRPISDDPAEPIDLLVVMHERETGWVSLGGGFGDTEGPQASVEYQQLNLFGTGRPLRLEGVLSQRTTRGAFTLRDPYLLGRQMIGELGLTYVRERRQENLLVETYGPSVSVSRPLTPNLLGTLRYAWSRLSYPDVAPGNFRIDSIATTGLTYDSRSDILNPRWGTLTQLNVDLASPLLGGTLLYTRPRLVVAHFVPLPRRIVLAFGGEMGYVQPLGSTTGLPRDLLFLAGGANSLRGYPFNQVGATGVAPNAPGGQALLVTHSEVRVPVWGDVGAVAFVDAGNVWASAAELGFRNLRATTGLGLRYMTPVGPLRVDYGVPVYPSLSWGEFHFGIGHAF